MKKTTKKSKARKPSKAQQVAKSPDVPTAYVGEIFVTAQQASATLNLPLYYFLNTAKRDELGVPHYCINRLVRYRLKELHRWQVRHAARLEQERQVSAASAPAVQGGAHA